MYGRMTLRRKLAAELNKTMNPGAVNAAMENIWPIVESVIEEMATRLGSYGLPGEAEEIRELLSDEKYT